MDEQDDIRNLKRERRGLLPGYDSGRYEPARTYDPAEFLTHADDPVRRDHRVNVRLSSVDQQELQRRALAEGLPLQSLLARIIHEYATGQLLKAEVEAEPVLPHESRSFPRPSR
jgi:hypothetical protein